MSTEAAKKKRHRFPGDAFTTSFRLDETSLEILAIGADALGVNKVDVVRMALREFAKTHKLRLQTTR